MSWQLVSQIGSFREQKMKAISYKRTKKCPDLVTIKSNLTDWDFLSPFFRSAADKEMQNMSIMKG